MNALFVAWRAGDDHNGVWGPVGRLEYDGKLYRFCYTRGARTLPGFRPFPRMEDLDTIYDSEGLLPVFTSRLLSPSRPEYEAYLVWGGFDPNNPPEPLALLGVTEGIRQTDAIELFPCPMPDEDGCYVNKFFLHGIRWFGQPTQERIQKLAPGERLFLMPDPCNPHDRHAVAVRTEKERTLIGYVPRYLARDVGKLLHDCDPRFIEVIVERVNRDAPMQNRLLCRMNACWPNEFKPCDDEAFQPIPTDVPARCDA